jgi:hypothetical protein
MKRQEKKVKVRNFVAKNATTGGAGRHTNKKKDYNRQQEKRLTRETSAKED